MLFSSRLGAKVLGTSVPKYQFYSTHRYSVLILFKVPVSYIYLHSSTLKNERTLMSTYEYFMSTNHL